MTENNKNKFILKEKIKKLESILKNMGSVVIAFSGGVDSSLLLKIAADILGNNIIAVTKRSPLFPKKELGDAKKIAKNFNCRHTFIDSNELKIEEFRNNSKNRCYICKKDLFLKLITIKDKYKFNYIADGTNYNDSHTFRPGLKALTELNIKSPFLECKITKEEIRQYSKILNIKTWNKPSFSCLATRIPYNEKISPLKLHKIEKAEECLSKLGFSQVRVRYHHPIARIEVEKSEFIKITKGRAREEIIKEFKKIGFKYVTIDLEGYRSGSMDK